MNQLEKTPTQEKVNSFRYLITKFNEKKMANAKQSLPIPFELVTVWTSTDKKIAAWWTGKEWDGLHLKENDQVLFWERRLYDHRS